MNNFEPVQTLKCVQNLRSHAYHDTERKYREASAVIRSQNILERAS
eukprot:COSAG05_NODE_7171_length_847_cov_1.053476_3_plen_45_part_01